ncbi:MAG: DNA polymerase IV [Anaerolineales bacterium]
MDVRTIIHLDLDAFYCAVEELHNPDLHGKPFAVGGRPEGRGVVSSCSYAARRVGVRSAMPMARAIQLCPDLIILPGSHREYGRKSRQVMEILHQITDLVEQISIDEAFLDVTAIQGDTLELARTLQQRIKDETQLPCSLGIASNKLVAKIATDVGKASVQTDTYPNAIQAVPPGYEADFLAPLPLETLWGVGPKTAESLHRIGVQKIGDLAHWPVPDLSKRLGKIGFDLHARANGIDNRPVTTHRDPKSVSQEVTYGADTNDRDKINRTLRKQAQQVAASLQRANFLGSTVKLKLRWADFTTITRQITLPEPMDDEIIILESAKKLLKHNWDGRTLIRLIGVGVSGLQPPTRQLSLWDKVDFKKMAQLEAAIYQVQSRYGPDVIHRGPTSAEEDRKEPS